ncbi:MAG: hypothetical protein ACOZQL_40760 [Myxococcota bacterium]
MRPLVLLALCALPALAKEVARDEHGAVLEASGFYKSLLSAVVLRPETVDATRQQVSLLGLKTTVPEAGFTNAHLLRLASKFRFEDKVELDVAWQLQATLASDPLFAASSPLSSTIGGTGAGAQRRVVELGGNLGTGQVWRVDHNLDRLALKLGLPFGDLTIGRQVLSWGTGRLWNPTDVLSPFPPTVVDREVRRGFDAVRLAVALGDVTQLDLLWLPQQVAEDNGAVARFQTNVLGWDGSVSVGKYVRDLVIGADLVGDVGPVGVHAEGAYTLELRGLGTGRVDVGEHFFRGVVGAEARPHEKVLVMLEYSYNGYGSNDPKRYAAILSSARVLRGEIFGAGMHQAALAVSFAASELLSTGLSVLANLADPSVMLIPTLEYSFTQTVLVRGGAYVPIGRPVDVSSFDLATRGLRSEYGGSGYGAFLQVGLHVP